MIIYIGNFFHDLFLFKNRNFGHTYSGSHTNGLFALQLVQVFCICFSLKAFPESIFWKEIYQGVYNNTSGTNGIAGDEVEKAFF